VPPAAPNPEPERAKLPAKTPRRAREPPPPSQSPPTSKPSPRLLVDNRQEDRGVTCRLSRGGERQLLLWCSAQVRRRMSALACSQSKMTASPEARLCSRSRRTSSCQAGDSSESGSGLSGGVGNMGGILSLVSSRHPPCTFGARKGDVPMTTQSEGGKINRTGRLSLRNLAEFNWGRALRAAALLGLTLGLFAQGARAQD